MKKLILSTLAVAALTFTSCNQTKKEEVVVEQPTEEALTQEFIDMHNAENSLDLDGTYVGMLPCADCEGIQTEITLNPDNTYQIKTVYAGGKGEGKVFTEEGKWSIKVSTLTLEDDKKAEAPKKYFAGENFIKQLDTEAKEITGSLAEHYILKKK